MIYSAPAIRCHAARVCPTVDGKKNSLMINFSYRNYIVQSRLVSFLFRRDDTHSWWDKSARLRQSPIPYPLSTIEPIDSSLFLEAQRGLRLTIDCMVSELPYSDEISLIAAQAADVCYNYVGVCLGVVVEKCLLRTITLIALRRKHPRNRT